MLRGFTLIEMLVSVALFSIIMMITIGTLLTLVDANRQAQSLQSITTNMNFALDSMARTVRTGYSYYCGTTGWTSGAIQDCANGSTALYFKDHNGVDVVYAYNATNKSIERTKGGVTAALTAPEIRVTSMAFFVTGTGGKSLNNTQPTITLMIQAAAGDDPGTDTTFNIQTTLTERVLDL